MAATSVFSDFAHKNASASSFHDHLSVSIAQPTAGLVISPQMSPKKSSVPIRSDDVPSASWSFSAPSWIREYGSMSR